MRKFLWVPICLGITLLLLPSYAAMPGSKERSFRAELGGFQEVPAVSTEGVGEFSAKLNTDGTELTFELQYEDISGTAAASHVHLGQRGVNGAPMFFICGGGGKPACPTGTSGTITGTVTAADIVGPAAQGIAAGEFAKVLRAMRAGVAYVNIHTAKHTGGEIRGQIKDRGLGRGRD